MSGLTAVATISSGSVTGITITGYTIGDNTQDRYSNKEITIDGNATAEIVLGKKIGNVWITEGGSGFASGTTTGYIRGIGGSGADLDAQCRTIKRTTFNITNPGYGYDSTPTVTLTSSGAGQFLPTASAEIDDEGRITAVNITSEGSYGYTVTSLTITGFAPGGTYDIQTKCYRDIGLILDAYIYHLQLGGNEKIVTAAEMEATLKRLLVEIEATKRRVNALEFKVIPEMQEAQSFIQLRLEEMEREETFRLKRFKNK